MLCSSLSGAAMWSFGGKNRVSHHSCGGWRQWVACSCSISGAWGSSHPVSLKELPALEEWADDVLTVMDHARSDRAAVVAVGGVSLGGAAPFGLPAVRSGWGGPAARLASGAGYPRPAVGGSLICCPYLAGRLRRCRGSGSSDKPGLPARPKVSQGGDREQHGNDQSGGSGRRVARVAACRAGQDRDARG